MLALALPADQEVAPDVSAKLTAATNLDDWVDTSTSITYEWQKRALDSDPDDPDDPAGRRSSLGIAFAGTQEAR